jgi:hypothetical protein
VVLFRLAGRPVDAGRPAFCLRAIVGRIPFPWWRFRF